PGGELSGVRPSSVLDQDERPDGDEAGQVVDVLVLERDAAERPVEAVLVERRLVGAVDADRATDPREAGAAPRATALLHRDPVAMHVLEVGIVEEEKLPPARVRPLVDDHVEAGRRPEIALVELLAGAGEAEDGGVAPDAVAAAIDVDGAAAAAHDD